MNSLEKIVSNSGLDKSKSDYLLEKFADCTAVAESWALRAKEIVVTDESQVELMKQASEGRKLLKTKRVEIEKTRKDLKAASLAEGRAIDDIAKALTALIEPTEQYLQLQEDFKKIKEQQRIVALREQRMNEIVTFITTDDLVGMGDLGAMSESQYGMLFTGIKVAYENRVAAEKKEREDAIAKEEQDKKEREAQRIENERLKKEADEREKQFAAERKAAQEKADKERAELEAKAKEEREKAAAEAKKQKEIQDKKLKEEREAREKVEAELKAKREQEQKEIEDAEKLASAGDKEKIKDLIKRLHEFNLPEVKSKKAKAIVTATQIKITELIDNITQSSSKL